MSKDCVYLTQQALRKLMVLKPNLTTDNVKLDFIDRSIQRLRKRLNADVLSLTEHWKNKTQSNCFTLEGYVRRSYLSSSV